MSLRLSVYWLLPLGAMLLGSGCLFKHHSTNVVRQNEQRREVQFESLSAQQAFSAKAFSDKSREAGTKTKVLAIPLLLWRSKMDVLSENAYFNDRVAACDTNSDGIITVREAVAYHPAATFDELAAASASGRSSVRRGSPDPADIQTAGLPETSQSAPTPAENQETFGPLRAGSGDPRPTAAAEKVDPLPAAPLPVEQASFESKPAEVDSAPQATDAEAPESLLRARLTRAGQSF